MQGDCTECQQKALLSFISLTQSHILLLPFSLPFLLYFSFLFPHPFPRLASIASHWEKNELLIRKVMSLDSLFLPSCFSILPSILLCTFPSPPPLLSFSLSPPPSLVVVVLFPLLYPPLPLLLLVLVFVWFLFSSSFFFSLSSSSSFFSTTLLYLFYKH